MKLQCADCGKKLNKEDAHTYDDPYYDKVEWLCAKCFYSYAPGMPIELLQLKHYNCKCEIIK